MGISDVSSGLCSSDLGGLLLARRRHRREQQQQRRRIDREYEGEAGDAGPVQAAIAIFLVARLALRHAGETRLGPGAAAPRKKSARGHFRPRESLSFYQSFTPVPTRAFRSMGRASRRERDGLSVSYPVVTISLKTNHNITKTTKPLST